jgi:hypothetical protein
MMRGLRPLFVIALLAANAQATEMIEVPTPPPPPPPRVELAVCCFATAPGPDDPRLLVAVDAGPSVRAAFGTSFAGVAAEVLLGGDAPNMSFAGRLHLDLGLTVDLPYEHVAAGMVVLGRLSPRVRLGLGFLFGFLMYQRASATRIGDPTVWAPTLGVDVELTVDLVRTRRGGALFALARAGYEYVDNLVSAATGSSFTGGLALGYRR